MPPLPLTAVPAPEAVSRTMTPPPELDWTIWTAAPAVVAGVAVESVMLPVCWLSPIVTTPEEVVNIRASSLSVRLMPVTALSAPPSEIGRDSNVLYAHLGGQPAINAYSALFRN